MKGTRTLCGIVALTIGLSTFGCAKKVEEYQINIESAKKIEEYPPPWIFGGFQFALQGFKPKHKYYNIKTKDGRTFRFDKSQWEKLSKGHTGDVTLIAEKYFIPGTKVHTYELSIQDSK